LPSEYYCCCVVGIYLIQQNRFLFTSFFFGGGGEGCCTLFPTQKEGAQYFHYFVTHSCRRLFPYQQSYKFFFLLSLSCAPRLFFTFCLSLHYMIKGRASPTI
jgi:hypothetical protein